MQETGSVSPPSHLAWRPRHQRVEVDARPQLLRHCSHSSGAKVAQEGVVVRVAVQVLRGGESAVGPHRQHRARCKRNGCMGCATFRHQGSSNVVSSTDLSMPGRWVVHCKNEVKHGPAARALGGGGGAFCRDLGVALIKSRLFEHTGSVCEGVLHRWEGGQHSVQHLGWFTGLHGAGLE